MLLTEIYEGSKTIIIEMLSKIAWSEDLNIILDFGKKINVERFVAKQLIEWNIRVRF